MVIKWPEDVTASELLRKCVVDTEYGHPSTYLNFLMGGCNGDVRDEKEIFLILADQIEKEIKQARISSWPSYIQAPVDEDGKMWTIGDCVIIDGKEGYIENILCLLNIWHAVIVLEDETREYVFLQDCKRWKEDSLDTILHDMLKDSKLCGTSYAQRIQDLMTKNK